MAQAQTIPASEARNNFSDLISKVEYQHQEFLIERYGEVVAKLVPVTVEGKQTVQDSRQEQEFVQAEQEVKKTIAEASPEQVETSAPVKSDKAETAPAEASTQPTKEASTPAKKQPAVDNLEQYQPESVLQALQKLSDLSKKQSAEKSEDEVSQQDERVEVIRKRIKLLMDR
jgi:prevent-host-death family protein